MVRLRNTRLRIDADTTLRGRGFGVDVHTGVAPPPPSETFFRVTEAGNFRITEADNLRVIELNPRITEAGNVRITESGNVRITE